MKSLQICGRYAVFAVLTALSYGCAAPLPDVSPFVAASAQLRSGVASAGSATAGELARVPGGEAYAKQLTTEWAARVRACDALLRYAQSLQDITQAGAQGRESAQAVADSITALASAASFALPAAGALSVGVDTARFVYAQIALVRASNSLEAALAAASPAVEEVTNAIALDMAQLASVLALATKTSQGELTQKYSTVLGYRRQLERQRHAAFAQLGTDAESGLGQRLQQLTTLLAGSEDEYSVYSQELADMMKRQNAARAVVRAAADAVTEWGAAHRALAAAVQQKRTVNVQNLVESTLELRALVKRMREL